MSTNFFVMNNERRGQRQAGIFIGCASFPPRYPFIEDGSFGMPGRTCRVPRTGKQHGKRGDTRQQNQKLQMPSRAKVDTTSGSLRRLPNAGCDAAMGRPLPLANTS